MQDNAVFLLNPDNADILNGERRAPGGGKPMSRNIKRVLLIGGLAYLALTIGGVIWMMTTLADWAALNAAGVIAEGRLIDRDTSIIRSQTSTMRTGNVIHYLIYQYTTQDGQTLQGEAQVTEQAYQNYVQNAPVQVLYLESSPGVSRLAKENAFEFPRMPVFAGGANGLIVLIGGLMMCREFRQRRRYQRDGRVICGVVVAPKLNEGTSNGRRVATLYLNYRITSPVTGAEIHRMQQQRRDDLMQSDLPAEGSRLAVLYVDDRQFTVL